MCLRCHQCNVRYFLPRKDIYVEPGIYEVVFGQWKVTTVYITVFFLWFFLQFGIRDTLENAAGQESEELCLNCNPNGSLRSVSIPSSFLLRCSKECAFLLSPSQNWKKPNVLIAQGDVHMKSHIYPMCKGSQLFLIFCFILSSRP